MTQDVERLCEVFSQIIAKILIAPFKICYYVFKTWKK